MPSFLYTYVGDVFAVNIEDKTFPNGFRGLFVQYISFRGPAPVISKFQEYCTTLYVVIPPLIGTLYLKFTVEFQWKRPRRIDALLF